MKVCFINGVKNGETLELMPQGVSLGRETDNDITLLVEGVSRYHSKIELKGDNWIIRDLGSTNGTEINGETINGSQVLMEGDIIDVGDQKLRFGDAVKSAPLKEERKTSVSAPPIEAPVSSEQDAIPDSTNNNSTEEQSNFFKSKETQARKGYDKKDIRKVLLNVIFFGGVFFVAAIFILVFLSTQVVEKKKTSENQTETTKKDKPSFALLYQREVISFENDSYNIFYVTLQIEGNDAYLTLDDLISRRKASIHATKISQSIIDDFENNIWDTDFFTLPVAHASSSAGETSNTKTIMVASKGKLKKITIKDEIPPHAFLNVESIIRDFTSQILNVDTLMTAEETKLEGNSAFYKAQSLYKNYDADPANLKEAIKRYTKAENLLGQFPYESEELIIARRNKIEANKLRDKKLSALAFSCTQAQRMNNIDDAISACYQTMALCDIGELRYKNAKKLVIKMEAIKRKRNK